MGCLSTTPTQNLTCHAMLRQTGPPEQVDCLARFGIIGIKCLPKNAALYCPDHELNQEPTILQLPTCTLIH